MIYYELMVGRYYDGYYYELPDLKNSVLFYYIDNVSPSDNIFFPELAWCTKVILYQISVT